MRFQGSTHLLILVGGNPEFPYIKLQNIIEDIGLSLNTEKTRLVEAKEGFDFLGFRFARRNSGKRDKFTTRRYPSPRSEKRIRERIRNMTGRNMLAITTLKEAPIALLFTFFISYRGYLSILS
ncbi:MAG: hypothetical protein ACYCR2_10950 [Thermoplasmataceae archaeon]